jgi:hypothetical protein
VMIAAPPPAHVAAGSSIPAAARDESSSIVVMMLKLLMLESWVLASAHVAALVLRRSNASHGDHPRRGAPICRPGHSSSTPSMTPTVPSPAPRPIPWSLGDLD